MYAIAACSQMRELLLARDLLRMRTTTNDLSAVTVYCLLPT